MEAIFICSYNADPLLNVFPFLAEKLGYDLTCLMLFLLTSNWNFLGENWVLLSLTVCSGAEFVKTAVFSFCIYTELNLQRSVFHVIILSSAYPE